MVTKNQFIEQLQPIKCSICLENYNSNHVPVELSCGHIFGDHCIIEQTETRMPNNNRCPLCRHELFEQEDCDSVDEVLYSSDEALIEVDDDDDLTDDDETYQEFREYAARMRELNRESAPKSSRHTRTYNEADQGSDSGSDGSEYESEEDIDSADEREENHAYRLLPGEHETTLSDQPSEPQ